MLAGFNEFGFNEPSRFNGLVLTSKVFLLHIKFGFNEYPGLTNNWPGPERYVKSVDHCTVKSRFNESRLKVKSRFKVRNVVTKMKFYIKKSQFSVKSQFKESKCADKKDIR